MAKLGVTETTLQGKTLFAQHNYGPVLQKITIATGVAANYAAGQVLGKITASGKYTAYSDAAVDGSEVARAVLTEAVDATAADQEAMIAVIGVVVEANLTGLDANGKADLAAAGFFFA